MKTAQSMLEFLQKSPTPYHCVEESARRLRAAGFQEIDEHAEPAPIRAGQGAFIRRSGLIVAWRAGSAAPSAAGFRMIGAHTDSPNLRIKPRADAKNEGYVQWGVEVYGGVLMATWADRDLGLSGRVFVRGKDGQPEQRLLRIDKPIARVPNLAIHYNRKVNDEGLKLDAQKHLVPVVGLVSSGEPVAFVKFLAGQLNEDVISWDLCLHDIVPPTFGGLNDEFIFSARIDNQAGSFMGLTSLLEASTAPATQVVALFDHEEVGSRSHTGAMGATLRDVLARIERDHEEKGKGGLERALANSFLISCDMAHGVHPNYANLHEPHHKPQLNGGPVIKEHVEQRYATDAETSAIFRLACQAEGVPSQDFVIRTDLGCGSTIGPISAGQLGVRTVDVGCAMLSMHSIREQCGAKDPEMMIRVMKRILSDTLPLR
ncbi:MAG TPA: M18 family aminopeptidase [Myxococcaceae bacterium]|nr:M18 family aminopeptidase [Myxococcaceae bacterium]